MYTKYQAAGPGRAAAWYFVYILVNNIFDKSTDSKPNRETPYRFEPSDRYDTEIVHVL